MAKGNGKKAKAAKTPQGITHITVGGYKSIAREQTIEIRPLTVLAGANSSGKSSIMQPLLLLKQTLEAPYDPGALLLNGPNVKFTSVDQMLSRSIKRRQDTRLVIGLATEEAGHLRLEFGKGIKWKLEINSMTVTDVGAPHPHELRTTLPTEMTVLDGKETLIISDVPNRCFLERHTYSTLNTGSENPQVFEHVIFSGAKFQPPIQHIMHLPGLRGNPERAYSRAAVGKAFPGTFENYFASVIAHWSSEGAEALLAALSADLRRLGLTWKIEAKAVNDTQLELKVGRLPLLTRGSSHDLVNIADVGFGVSQTLPVLVALLVAEPGQLVYLEQPEIHLHPRAQVAMAQILANAANRGVRVVVETHSSLLLLAIQTAVAEGQLTPDKVILHWFARNDEGATDIQSAELDEAGRAGDWPEDFADVSLEAQMHYLKAAGNHQVAQ